MFKFSGTMVVYLGGSIPWGLRFSVAEMGMKYSVSWALGFVVRGATFTSIS